MSRQSHMQVYSNLLRYHGPFRGTMRIIDQFFQNDLYDAKYKTNFSQMLGGNEFYQSVENAVSVMHYQPVYTQALKKPLLYLRKNFPIFGAPSSCFIDLGCGRGKALHIVRNTMEYMNVMGVDLNKALLADAIKNLKLPAKDSVNENYFYHDEPSKASMILQNVLEVDYKKVLAPFDLVVVFNKNSFGKTTLSQSLKNIVEACEGKEVFYIYNNPVFEKEFDDFERVYRTTGWHKNWNTDVYRIK